MLKKIDLAWILTFPLCQTLGTLRHEASNAFAALLKGAQIEEFVFWPTVITGVFRWAVIESNFQGFQSTPIFSSL